MSDTSEESLAEQVEAAKQDAESKRAALTEAKEEYHQAQSRYAHLSQRLQQAVGDRLVKDGEIDAADRRVLGG